MRGFGELVMLFVFLKKQNKKQNKNKQKAKKKQVKEFLYPCTQFIFMY